MKIPQKSRSGAGGRSNVSALHPVLSMFALVLLITVPAFAQDDNSLEELEKAMAADEAAQDKTTPSIGSSAVGAIQSMNPDLALIGDFAAAWFSQKENLESGGHDPNKTGFNLQQLELSVGGTVDAYFRFDANIVFSQFGVEVEEAYATTLALPARLQVRAGQFLTRFGRVNPTHPHTWDFTDQMFAVGRYFGGEGNRGLGVESSILMPLPWYVELVGSMTEAGGESTARSFYGATDLGAQDMDDFQYTPSLKQFFPLGSDLSLMWGLSLATGPNPTGRENRSEVYGSDFYLKYRPVSRESHQIVSLQGEWMYRRYQVPDDVIADQSGYAYLFWRFAQRWAVAGRYEFGSPSTNTDGDEVADPVDPTWLGERTRVAGNVTFWPTEFSRLRLQYGRDMAEWLPENIDMVFLALEVSIGAHGAHSF